MKPLNPLAAVVRPSPQPAVPAQPATPATPAPAGDPGALAATIAAALAPILAAGSPAVSEARIIELIREHSITPPPQPGLHLTRPESEPVSYDQPLHAYAKLLVKLVEARVPVYLWSGSGTSKTRLAHACALLLKIPFYSDSYTRGIGRAEILGYRDATGQPVETQVSQAFTKGGLYLADEGDSDGVGIVALNRVLANEHAVFAGRMIEKHADFRIVFAGNTNGDGQANGYRREKLDAALLDRLFVLELPVDEALEHQAAGIGGRVPDPPECDLTQGGVVTPERWGKIAGAYRKAAKELSIGTPLTTSGRPLWMGAHLSRHGVGVRWLVDGLIRKSRPQDVWDPWRSRAEAML